MKGLSKSRIIAWKQCPKQLWLQAYQPSLADVSESSRRNFQIGNAVGAVARAVYPSGILIEDVFDLKSALKFTQEALAAHPKQPLFEAAFQHDGVLVRADVMLPGKQGYRMVEVKSSTGLKDYHLNDCAIQTWIVKQNGIPLTSIELAHIDTSFVYQGDKDYRGLFCHVPLDAQLEPLLDQVPGWIEGARDTLSSKDEPAIEPGEQCVDPFECPFYAYCTRNMEKPEEPEFPLDVFYRMQTAKKEALFAQGYQDALDVPEMELNETQRWIQRVSRSGKAELKPAAQQALSSLPYPRYHLDFETITLAVPRWAGTRPYGTQVPFQWSCHIEDEPGKLRHAMFLDTSGGDPRRPFAESMIKILGKEGPVFVYNQSFEKARIKELAEHCSDLADDLLAINERVVDLLPIAHANYYHPDMKGSWSIKAVLPTIAPDLAYDDLEVGNGEDAQVAYTELLDQNTSNEQRKKLVEGLMAYCERDTLAMVRIAWFFERGGNMDGVQFPEPEEKYLMTRSRASIEVAGDAVTQEDMDRADHAAIDASANAAGIPIESRRIYFEIDHERQMSQPLGKKSKSLASVWEIERFTRSNREPLEGVIPMSKPKMTQKDLDAFGFEKIGKWQFCADHEGNDKYGSVKHLSNMKGIEFLIPNKELKKEQDVVYAFLAGDEVIYVGETTCGMVSRFPGYRYGNPKESDTDNNVKKEITRMLESGDEVSIWFVKPVASISHPNCGLSVPASKPFEEYLIGKFYLRANKKNLNAKK